MDSLMAQVVQAQRDMARAKREGNRALLADALARFVSGRLEIDRLRDQNF